MKHISLLMKEANEYTEAYVAKYNITDADLMIAIYKGHLAYLINKEAT